MVREAILYKKRDIKLLCLQNYLRQKKFKHFVFKTNIAAQYGSFKIHLGCKK